MFARLVKDLKNLSAEERKGLFSNLLSGNVTWAKLVEGFEANGLESVRSLSEAIKPDSPVDEEPPSPREPSSPFDGIEIDHESVPFDEQDSIDQFFALPVKARVELAKNEKFKAKLLNQVRYGGRTHTRLLQQMAKDATFHWAAMLLISYYAELIYDNHRNLSTADQIKAIQSLVTGDTLEAEVADTKAPPPLQSLPLDVQVTPAPVEMEELKRSSQESLFETSKECLHLCEHLCDSINTNQSALDYFRDRLARAVTYQTESVAPFNKTVRFLRRAEDEVKQSKWDTMGWEWRWDFWVGKTPEGIKNWRLLFNGDRGLSDKKMDVYDEKTFEPASVKVAFTESKKILDAKAESFCMRATEVIGLYSKHRQEAKLIQEEESALQDNVIEHEWRGMNM